MKRAIVAFAVLIASLVPALPAQAGPCDGYPLCTTKNIKAQSFDDHDCSSPASCIWTPVGDQNLKVRAYGAVATTIWRFSIPGAILSTKWIVTEASYDECIVRGDAQATMSTDYSGRTTYTIKSNRARRADNTCNFMYIKVWYNPYV